jgi:SAM-dependent methyltransferase
MKDKAENSGRREPTGESPRGAWRRPRGAPPPGGTKRHARRQFEKWAQSYDRSLLNELVFFPSVRACQEEILRWQAARGPRGYRMLDIGCGTGSLLTLMAHDPLAELLVGLDYAREMARQAAEKFAQSAFSAKLCAIQGDSERLPLPAESFDVVTCCNSFHHYPQQAAAVCEFRRVLRPGGLLVLVDGFRDNVIGWIVFDVGVALAEKHVHHASWSELHAMLWDAGFAELRQRKTNVLAPLLVNVATVGR